MSISRICFIVVVLVNLCSGAYAQESNCVGCKQARINLMERANYYREHPLPLRRKEPMDEEDKEDRPKHRSAPASEVHLYQKAIAVNNVVDDDPRREPLLPVSNAPNDTFQSTISPTTSIPPDTHGAVDSQYCVTAINTNVHVQDRIGGNIANISLDGFWMSVLPAGTDAFDPRIHYDPYNKRWIIVTDAVESATKTNSTLMVGVSETGDPTGMWNLYALPIDPSGSSWLDFPNVGFNQKWVVVTGNMFPNVSGGASGAVIYIFDYAAMRAGSPLPTPTKISKSSSFSICPALTYDVTQQSIFAVETWSPNNGQLRLWKISGAVSAPVMTSIGYPANSQRWYGSPSTANFGPQLGTTNKLDVGDDRITSCIYRNKRVWCAHTAFLPRPGTVNRASVMWWQLDTTAAPVQVGLVNDPTAAKFYAYPSIAVNKNNDALIGCAIFSASIHPSCAYALRLNTDPLDSIRPAYIFRHGQATYFTTFSGTKNRWGDYSNTCIDPRNDEDFWTIQEASIPGTTANWDTWWAKVQICPKPSAPTFAWAGAPPCPGDTMSYRVNPIPGATSYTWSVLGAGWTWTGGPSTTLALTAGPGRDTVVVYATNACGQGESRTVSVTPASLPPAPFITVLTPPCNGVDTILLSATGSASFNWQVLGTGWSGSSTTSSLYALVGTGTGRIICNMVNACGAGPSDTLDVIVGTPTANFNLTTHNTYTGVNVTATYAGTAPAGSTFTWGFSGGTATPGTGVGPHNISWSTTGTKNVSLTVNNNGCSTFYTDTVRVRVPISVPQVNGPGNSINIVPNPNEGAFDIVFDEAYNTAITVRITDVEGRTVYQNEFNGTVNNKLPVNISSLAAGMYAVSINVDGSTVVKQVMINK